MSNLFLSSRRCACGKLIEGISPFCDACWDVETARTTKLAEQQWRSEISGLVRFADVPAWAWARLENAEFLARIGSAKLIGYARAYEPTHGSVLLSGYTGAGKTSLTVAALHRLRAAEVAKVLARPLDTPPTSTLRILSNLVWTTGFDLVKARREQPFGRGEAELVKAATRAPLLVIDELGYEPQTDTVIREVADARYVAELPTIVTTGLTVPAFRKQYGDATFRRLTERGNVVEAWK